MYSTPQSVANQVADYHWLVGPEGQKWLQEAQNAASSTTGQSIVRLTELLRRSLTAPQVHLVLQQLELRSKARDKFPQADQMFFTPQGLEQSTDHWIAAYKAARMPASLPLADLCCGIGGDLLALAERGPVRAIDRNPSLAIIASANTRALAEDRVQSQHRTEVVAADVAAISLAGIAAWHIDPDRRPAGRRTTKVALHEPAPEVLAKLLAHCPHSAIKLSPAADFAEPWWAEAELQWISRARQCRQLVAWFGNLAQYPGQRRATSISGSPGTDSCVAADFLGQPNVHCPQAANIGRFLFEPDPAVLAAKLEGALAAENELSPVAAGVAYFTADRPVQHPMLAGFEVLEVLPYRTKLLRAWLAARGMGRLEVKKRGVPLDPDEVRRQLQTKGDQEATILLARIKGRVAAIIAQRK